MSELIQILASLLYLAIFARVILSWFPQITPGPILHVIYFITEPVLGPIRRFIPQFGNLDISPLVALILLGIIQRIIRDVVS